MIHDQFRSSYNLADLMFGSAGTPTYVTFIEADHTGHDVAAFSAQWAGGIGSNPGPAMYGPWKAFSLLAGGKKRRTSKTPLTGSDHNFPWPDYDEGCPWAGGYREDHLIVSCSAWENDQIDLMFALLLYWSMDHEVRFHHIGFRHPDRESRNRAVQRDEERYQTWAEPKPAPDHERNYIPVRTNRSPNGIYWVEHQLWPNDWTPGTHWDVATSDPERMIEFIAENSGLEAETWERKPNSPCSLVMAEDVDGREIAIMARPTWTHVDTW